MITIAVNGPDKERAPVAAMVAELLLNSRQRVMQFKRPDVPSGADTSQVDIVILSGQELEGAVVLRGAQRAAWDDAVGFLLGLVGPAGAEAIRAEAKKQRNERYP